MNLAKRLKTNRRKLSMITGIGAITGLLVVVGVKISMMPDM